MDIQMRNIAVVASKGSAGRHKHHAGPEASPISRQQRAWKVPNKAHVERRGTQEIAAFQKAHWGPGEEGHQESVSNERYIEVCFH